MHLNLGSATRWGLNCLLLLALALALYLGRVVFIPIVISLLLAAMLWPAVQWLNVKLRLPWSVACSVMIGLLVVMLAATAAGLATAVPKVVQQLPTDEEAAEKTYAKFRTRLVNISPWELNQEYLPEKASESKAVQYLRNALDPQKSQFVFNTLGDLGKTGLYLLWQSVLILFILFFLLLEGRMLTRRLVEVFGPSLQTQQRVVAALQDMANQIRAFLVWRTIINFAMALIFGLLYHLMGLAQPWTWALITAVLLYVPYLGPIMAGIPPVLDAFVTCESPWMAVWLAVLYTVFITVEGYFVVPVVMGRSMEMNATTVMLACMFWELVWGPAGLFLAMPLMAAAKTICYHVPEWRAWANLMDTREGPADSPPPDDLPDLTQVVPPPVDGAKTEKVDATSADVRK
jgi:predicted PurR-regulated permease PerM